MELAILRAGTGWEHSLERNSGSFKAGRSIMDIKLFLYIHF